MSHVLIVAYADEPYGPLPGESCNVYRTLKCKTGNNRCNSAIFSHLSSIISLMEQIHGIIVKKM